MLKKLLSVALFAVIMFPALALAQSGSVTGRVTDSNTGEPLQSATVFIQQLQAGTVTDMDGRYVLSNVRTGTYAVRISYVGYKTFNTSVTVGTSSVVLNATLEPDFFGLEDLVVVGYGTASKRELTGSISSVRSSEIQNVSLQNAESILQGRAAGVTVTTTSGNPGGAFRVNVRGNGSINAATEPLYIIDGVQISFSQLSGLTSTSPLNAINPSDIESIEVLKDAAAAAIYGAQAAAGVVIITTKQGRAGQTQITANVQRGVRSLAQNVDYITSEQYVTYMAEARSLNLGETDRIDDSFDLEPNKTFYKNFFLGFFGADPDSDPADPQLANTDWQDFIFSDGATANYNLSMSGGNQTTTFFLSAGYEDTEGTAFDTDFKRYALRSNIDHQATNRISTSLRLNVSKSLQNGVCQDGNFINCPPSQAMFEAPMSFPYRADGSYNPNTRFGLATNPAVVENEVSRLVDVTQILSNLSATYRAADWLSFTGSASVDYRNTQDDQYRSPIAATAQNGFITYASRNVENFSTSFVANFRKTFDQVHNVSGLAGTEYRQNYSESYLLQGNGLPGPFFKVLSATSEPASVSGINSEFRIGSFFSSLRYNYNEKYYINFVGRYDGHSRFGSEQRWGFFPSLSAAWRITQEDFFDVGFIDELKVRAGFGTTGNSAIGNFAARGLFSTAGSYNGQTALAASQLANNNLTWEEAEELNIGVDFEFFEGRIYGSIDQYRKDNNELLFSRPLPLDSGFGGITENIGRVRNTGLEFEVNTVNVFTRDFQWSTRFNVAFVDNEILELPDGNDIGPSSTFNSLKIGKPIGLIQTARWAGVNPADGRPMWYDADGHITYTPDVDDIVEYKDGLANTVGGFGNTVSYKGLSLDVFFQFSFGQWAFPSTDYYFTRTPDFLMNMATEVESRWKKPGDITHYPRAVVAGTNYAETNNYRVQIGTQAIYNASYIRLKNISLGYTLPSALTTSLGLSSVRFYASAINMMTWTAWPWYDPEVAFSSTDIFNNVTTASYPTEKQVYGGVEIKF